jgi:hypothetical protein
LEEISRRAGVLRFRYGLQTERVVLMIQSALCVSSNYNVAFYSL